MISLRALLVGAIALTGTSAMADEIRIGMPLALTGVFAFAGVPSREGLELAAEEVNASKLLGDRKLVLEVEDTASDKTQAIALVDRFGADQGIVAIVGISTSGEGQAAAPVANSQKVPLLAPTALSDEILKAGQWSFKTSSAATSTITAVANHAKDKLKLTHVAIVYNRDNEASVAQRNVFRDIFKVGGNAPTEESVLSTDVDFSALITKLGGAQPEAIYLTLPAEQSANFIIQARQAGLSEIRFLCAQPCSSVQFRKVGGDAVEGTIFGADYFSGLDTPENKAFVESYKAKYGRTPDNFSALGYTAMKLAAEALKNAGPAATREQFRDALAKIKDFPVVLGTGKFSFQEDRSSIYGAPVLTVKNGEVALAE